MKKGTAIFLAMLMALSLCACGSVSDSVQANTTEYAASEPRTGAAEAYSLDESGGTSGLSSAGGAGADNGAAVPEGDAALELEPDKIIYVAEATVETTEFEASLDKLDQLIEKYGGWVESSSINNANYYNQSRGNSSNRSAEYTIRVPSDRFSTLMGSLSDIGNVPYTYSYTENVTADYYDIQARLKAYTTQETRLLEMMEKAKTINEVITIEDRLTELRYKIESLQSTLNNLDRLVSYSSINLNISEVQEYTPEAETKISYGRELWLALSDALKDAGSFFKGLLLFIVSILPTLVILAALFFLLRPVLIKLRASKRARRAETLEKLSAGNAETPDKDSEGKE